MGIKLKPDKSTGLTLNQLITLLKYQSATFYHSLYGVPSVETSPELLWMSVIPDWPSVELGSSPVVIAQSF